MEKNAYRCLFFLGIAKIFVFALCMTLSSKEYQEAISGIYVYIVLTVNPIILLWYFLRKRHLT